jgi:hypothetical protein
VRGLLSGECVRRRQRAADQRVAVDGGVAVRVRRGDSRANGIFQRGRCCFAVIDAASAVCGWLVRKRRGCSVHELPGGLLLHGRRGPSCGVPLRLLQRFGRRHDVRLLALRLRRGLLQQCDDFGGLRGHAGHVHAVLRRHGLHRRRRRARRVQRRHVLYAGRDVGGVHDVRGGRQLRPHGGWRLLQPRAELPLLRRLQQPRLSRLCHPATVHRLHEQRRRLHRLLPRLLRAVRGWRLRASIVWPVPGRHFQRRGRLQLLGLLVRGGLRLGGRRRSKLRGRGGQLRPVPRRLRLHWRRRAS